MRSCVEQRCEKFVSKPAAKHSAAIGIPFRRFPGLAPGAFINSYRLHRSTIQRRSEVKSSSEQVTAVPALISATRWAISYPMPRQAGLRLAPACSLTLSRRELASWRR